MLEKSNRKGTEKTNVVHHWNEAGTAASNLAKERGRNAFLKNKERSMVWYPELKRGNKSKPSKNANLRSWKVLIEIKVGHSRTLFFGNTLGYRKIVREL